MTGISTTLKLAILCAACAGVLWLIDNGSRARREAADTQDIPRRLNDVESVVVTLAGGECRTFRRDGSSWRIESPVSSPADDAQVQSLIDTLEQSRRIDHISPDEMSLRELSLADFGLDSPKSRLDIETARGRFTITFGIAPPAARDEVFAVIGGEKGVSVIQTKLPEKMERPLEQFSDRRLCRADLRNVVRISVETAGAGQPLRLKKQDGGSGWKIVSPEQLPADWTEMQNFFDTLAQTKINSFVYGGDRRANEEGTRTTIRLFTESDPLPVTLRIGEVNPLEGDAIAIGDSGFTATIDREAAARLRISLNSVRDRRVFATGPTLDVESLSISRNDGGAMDFVRSTEGDWEIAAPFNARAEQGVVAKLIGEMLSLKAEDYVPASALTNADIVAGTAAGIVFSAGGATNTLDCLFFDYAVDEEAPDNTGDGPAMVAVVLNGSDVASIAAASLLTTLRTLLASPEAAVSRRIGGYLARDILSITVSRANGSSQRFDFAPDGSMSIGGDDGTTEPISDSSEISARISGMLRFVANIEAESVLPPSGDAGPEDAGMSAEPTDIAVTVEPRNPQDKPLAIGFGPDAAGSQGVAARIDGRNAIFVFPQSVKELFARNFRESYHGAEQVKDTANDQ